MKEKKTVAVKYALDVHKLHEKANVEVNDYAIVVYADKGVVLPVFNNIGNEIDISTEQTKCITEIPTGIEIDFQPERQNLYDYPVRAIFILDKTLANFAIKEYNITELRGEVKIKLQNLSNKKVVVKEGTRLGHIVIQPVCILDCKVFDIEEK